MSFLRRHLTLTVQGYWKNHPDAWLATSLILGGQTYSQAQLLGIFDTSPRGDATYILAHQLIAAKLNVAQGVDDSVVTSTITNADNWLSSHSLGSDPSNSEGRAEEIRYSETLDDYNSGKIGPGSCGKADDDADSDGLTNLQEYLNNTDSQNADTDGDGISDGTEIGNPAAPADSDGDGIVDGQEWSPGADDPSASCTANDPICFNNDADGDGIPNYLDADSDGDGLFDADEWVGDTDHDNIPDYHDSDNDNDGISDSQEGDSDIDGDGTPDYKDSDISSKPKVSGPGGGIFLPIIIRN